MAAENVSSEHLLQLLIPPTQNNFDRGPELKELLGMSEPLPSTALCHSVGSPLLFGMGAAAV
jgi:hypothetical protein